MSHHQSFDIMSSGKATSAVDQEKSSNDIAGEDDLLSTINPSFIHEILLADTTDFSLSRAAGADNRVTLSFEEFNQCLDDLDKEGLDPSMVLKKAVRDHICETVARKPEMVDPVRNFLKILHNKIRSLIPNRKDLHSILKDEKVMEAQSLMELQPLVAKAAQSLSLLESEARSKSTTALVDNLQRKEQCSTGKNGVLDTDEITFWVTSIIYLLYKAELCEADKQDFYLVQVLAPLVHEKGPTMEQKNYQSQFGAFSSPKSSPETRTWIHSLVKSHNSSQGHDGINNLTASVDARKNLIRSGWVEDILFRDATQKPKNLPEILVHDNKRLQMLRDVTRIAVAGCALVLHACNSTGAESQVVLTSTAETSVDGRARLLQALKNRSKPPVEYENDAAEAVLALAKEWNAFQDLSDASAQSLKNRSIAVLRGEDSVLKLLNNRIKEIMKDLVVHGYDNKDDVLIPPKMQTGRGGTSSTDGSPPVSRIQNAAETVFCQRGFAVFASELATASKLAAKIIDLAIMLYFEELLDDMVLEACNEVSSTFT